MFKFLLVATLVPAMALAAVHHTACPNGAPTPQTLTVNDCSGATCILHAGQPLNARAENILAPAGSATATAGIVARIAGLDTGFELPPYLTNACEMGLVGGCPITAGSHITYELSGLTLDAPARGIPVEIEVNLHGDGGVPLGCLRFHAEIH